VGSAEFNFLYWTGFTRLIGSIAFSVSGRNREMAIPLSAGKKSQRSRLYYCQKNSLEEGFKFCLSSGKAKNPENPVDTV